MLYTLNDKELGESLLTLCREERAITLNVLLHLNEIEERRLHLIEGYGSMFSYCTEKLGYSESGASRRIRTARCLREFSVVREFLERGEVNLSTLSQVASVLTAENCSEVLSLIAGKSQNEVDAVLASFRPKALLREVIKPVAVKVVQKAQPLFLTKSFCNRNDREAHENNREVVVEKRFEVRFSLNEAAKRKLERVQSLMSGKFPKGAPLESVMEELLDEFLEKHSPEKKVERREKRQVQERSSLVRHGRHIPASVRDAVFVRDKGCCGFVGSNGKRCGSSWDLEIDHIKPYSCGGSNELDNLRVVCRAHNLVLAEGYFGKEFMARRVSG